MLHELFAFLKSQNYTSDKTKWYRRVIFRLFKELSIGDSAPGIILQICDTFIQELSKVDNSVSLLTLAELLEPFLKAVGAVPNKEVRERIMEKIFHPLLENNKTSTETSDDEAAAAAELAK
jgi:hypothetical protein